MKRITVTLILFAALLEPVPADWYGEAGIGVGSTTGETYKDYYHVGINTDVVFSGTVRGGYKFPTSEDWAKFKIEPAFIRLDKPVEDENLVIINLIMCLGDC